MGICIPPSVLRVCLSTSSSSDSDETESAAVTVTVNAADRNQARSIIHGFMRTVNGSGGMAVCLIYSTQGPLGAKGMRYEIASSVVMFVCSLVDLQFLVVVE
jgi:hypothetical protein